MAQKQTPVRSQSIHKRAPLIPPTTAASPSTPALCIDPFTKLLEAATNAPPDTVVVNHRKNKSAVSLIGFDPLLEPLSSSSTHNVHRNNGKPPKSGTVWGGGGTSSHPFDRIKQPASPGTAATTASGSNAILSAIPVKSHRYTSSIGSVLSGLTTKQSTENDENHDENDLNENNRGTNNSENHGSTLGTKPQDSQDRRGGLLKRLSRVHRHNRSQSLGGLIPKSLPRIGTPNPSSPSTGRRIAQVPTDALALPMLAKPSPTSFLNGHVDNAMRSSEQDPTPHQVGLPPTPSDCLVYTRLCSLLEDYKKHDQNFSFDAFRGMQRTRLLEFATTPIGKTNVNNKQNGTGNSNGTKPKLMNVHKPIASALADVTSNLPVTVAGHVMHDTAEALVLDGQHKVIVVLRGKGGSQQKPVLPKQARNVTTKRNLSSEQPATVYPPFREAFFGLERALTAILDRLVTSNPFAEVVFTGHSFGGATATIGAMRFATVRPATLVSCYTTSTPRVGDADFRSLVHTLPNLKVIRFEHGHDANTTIPTDSTSHTWLAVGHTVQLKGDTMKAYQFDKHKPVVSKVTRWTEKELGMYVQDFRRAVREKKWVSEYCGSVGSGVVGKDNEKRLMV